MTDAGYWVDVGRVRVVDEHDGSAIDEAVREALGRSGGKIAAPPLSVDLTEEIRALAGVKTWGAFVKGTKYVSVYAAGNTVRLTPYRRVDRLGNLEPISELECAASVKANLGELVIAMLAKTPTA